MTRQLTRREATTVKDAYAWYRLRGYVATQAIRCARIAVRFFRAGDAGLVRLEWELEHESYFDVYGAPDDPRERKALAELLDSEGVFCLCGQWRTDESARWETADTVGMCVGTDFSGYEPDIMASALDALDAHWQSQADALASRATYAGGST